MKKNAVVVGGGILGLSAYKILLSQLFKTKIIEQSSKLGGLLQSLVIDGHYFNHGAHFIRETGNLKLDKILFSQLKIHWNSFISLPQSNYFNQKWNLTSSYIDLRKAEQSIKYDFINHFNSKRNLSIKNIRKIKFKSEIDHCLSIYGKSLTNKIIIPILKKYAGKHAKNLQIDSRHKFALGRFIIDNSHNSKKLKKNEFIDNVVGFNNYYEGITGQKNYYPNTGGLESFVNYFVKKKESNYSNILLNTTIKKIEKKNNKIISIITNNNERINLDLLVWTGSKEILLKLLNSKITSSNSSKNPKFYWYFFHITSKNKFNSNSFFIHVHDTNFNIYRITLYDNFSKKIKNYRATIEVISYKKLDINKLELKIINELKILNISKKIKNLKINKSYFIPINMNKLEKNTDKYLSKFNNLVCTGYANQNNQPMEKMIYDIYNDILNKI